MGHNLVILKKASTLQHFALEAIKFAAKDYFPETKKDDVVATTKLLGPGESDTVIHCA